MPKHKHMFIYIPPFLVLKTLVILQYFVVKESPPSSGQQDLRIRQFRVPGQNKTL